MGIDNRRPVAVKAGSSEGMGRAVPVALDSRLRRNDGEGKSQDTVPIRHSREGGKVHSRLKCNGLRVSRNTSAGVLKARHFLGVLL